MTSTARNAAAISAVVIIAAIAAGCGPSHPAAVSAPPCLASRAPVAMAIGARSNNPEPPDLPADVSAATSSAIDAQQMVTIVRLDGNPHIVFKQALDLSGANSQQKKSDRNNYLNSLNRVLSGTGVPTTDIRAQIPQANVLEALEVAGASVPRGGNVILLDSGLQTTAPLDFRTGLLSDDPQTIANFLRNAGELPNLRGRQVLFFGLGWTASPQASLDLRNRNKVIQIWQSIAKAAGATCVAIDRTPDTQPAVPNRPPVGVVTPPPPPQPPVQCGSIDLGDANHVGFDFDSTTFRDPAGARATLTKVAQVILRSGESVKLTGATSSEGTDQYNDALSLRRADAVRGVLEQVGVPSSRITTFGAGSHLPGRLNDRGPNGQLLIGPAIQNRKVVAKLTGAGCPAA